MKKIIFLIMVIGILSNCSNEQDTDDVNIRLSNVSDFDFENIMVGSSKGIVSYGDLESGHFSEYQNFSLAYRYAFVELQANGETYIIQPIDYVGETPLSNGDYTYKLDIINIEDSFKELTINLVEE